MMIEKTQHERFDIQELKNRVLDNTLYLLKYNDYQCKYPEYYLVKRSDTHRKKVYVDNLTLRKTFTDKDEIRQLHPTQFRKWKQFYQYHIYLKINGIPYLEHGGGHYMDMGVLHPLDLIHRIEGNGDIIQITQVEIRSVDI